MSPLPTRPSVNPSNDSIRRGVMKRLLYTLLLLPVLAFGITSTAEAQEARKVKRNANLITLEEIQQTDVATLHELIERLRPRWLSARGTPTFGAAGNQGILVYQDQTRLGGIEVLRQLTPQTYTSIRYLDSSTASASLPGIGSGHVAGAIVLSTRDRK